MGRPNTIRLARQACKASPVCRRKRGWSTPHPPAPSPTRGEGERRPSGTVTLRSNHPLFDRFRTRNGRRQTSIRNYRTSLTQFVKGGKLSIDPRKTPLDCGKLSIEPRKTPLYTRKVPIKSHRLSIQYTYSVGGWGVYSPSGLGQVEKRKDHGCK